MFKACEEDETHEEGFMLYGNLDINIVGTRLISSGVSFEEWRISKL